MPPSTVIGENAESAPKLNIRKPVVVSSFVKSIKLKSGIVKRELDLIRCFIDKELQMYGKEAISQQSKIDALIASNADSHTVNKQKEVLLETQQIIPDCEKRLRTAYYELEALLKSPEATLEAEDEAVITAKALLSQIQLP